MRIELTEAVIAELKVPEGRLDLLVFDTKFRGFGVRIFASGIRSYFIKYMLNQKQSYMTIGPAVPGMLEEMRLRAAQLRTEVKLDGRDVLDEKREKRRQFISLSEAELQGLCPVCNKAFRRTSPATTYCSPVCSSKHLYAMQTPATRETINISKRKWNRKQRAIVETVKALGLLENVSCKD